MNGSSHLEAILAEHSPVQERLEALITSCFERWEECSPQTMHLAHDLIRTARALNNNSKLAFGLRFAARIHHHRAEHGIALSYLFEALEHFDALKDDRQRAACQSEIGMAYLSLGDYEDALSYFEASLRTCESINSLKGKQVSLLYIATTQKKLQNLDKALEYATQSLEIALELNDRSDVAELMSLIGTMHTDRGRRDLAAGKSDTARTTFERALESIGKSLEIAIELGNIDMRSNALMALCEALTELERFDTAWRVAQDALSLSLTLENPSIKAQALATMGRLQLRRDRPQAALEPMQQALEIFEVLEVKDDIARTHHELAQTRKALGQFEMALEHFERFFELDSQIRNQAAERRAQALAVNLEVTKTRHEAELQRVRNLELAAMNAELERLAKEDSLTSLANRRSLEAHMANAFAQAQTTGEALSVVVADIDHFKTINDRFSHAVGDQVLVAVAGILRSHCRNTDLAARSGGEEFVLVLRGVTGPRTFEVCERVRLAIQDHDWARIQPGLSVTLSLGFCDDVSLEHHERMLGVADARLYDAKHAGRNRVHPPVT